MMGEPKKFTRLRRMMASMKKPLKSLTNAHPPSHVDRGWLDAARYYRNHIVVVLAALAILSTVIYGGYESIAHRMQKQLLTVYHVFYQGQELGTVSSKNVVDAFLKNQLNIAQSKNPNLHIKLDTRQLTYQSETGFKEKSNNIEVLDRLKPLLKPKAYGIALTIDGKQVAVVNDEKTAKSILSQVKSHFMNKVKKEDNSVKILSAESADQTEGTPVLQQVGFKQQVQETEIPIQAGELSSAQDVVSKIITGDVEPTLYIVQPGDCISCIAGKFKISTKMIYDNNPSLKENSILHVGDQLNLTVLQPLLALKTVEQEKVQVAIPYDTTYKDDKNMLKGLHKVIVPGKEGQKLVTEKVTKVNGVVTHIEKLDESTVAKPVTAVVELGTKIISGLGTGHFRWPIPSPVVTSPYGYRKGIFKKGEEFHTGIDMVSRTGTRTIRAADNGKVKFVGWETGYGNVVILDHLNGYTTRYAHMKTPYVKVGQVVEKGQAIGYMGETGWATGVHVHFEVRYHGKTVNPKSVVGK